MDHLHLRGLRPLKRRYLKLQKYLIIFLFLVILPIVSASSLTGVFSDYGRDTGTDGLFNYLTIEAEVNINNASKDYMIFGVLEDGNGNLLQYSKCKSVSSTGKQNFILDFDGIQIYRNHVDGPYDLKYISLSYVDQCFGWGMPPELEHELNYAHTTQAYNYVQFQKGEAAIYCNNSPCIAPSSLIKSRNNIGTAEPNAPNTIDGCEDGGSGTYLDSESIESITVTSLDHSYFKIGDSVNVEIQVYCDDLSDKLNFVYSNSIGDIDWKVKDREQCSSTGLQTLSKTFSLDDNIGQHAVRGVFSLSLLPATSCGQDDPQDDWADTDDVVIYVKECNSGSDCVDTECDQLDSSVVGCYAGTFRDYHDRTNNCLGDFSCETKACTVYDEVITDDDGDNYDTECDNDCNNSNANVNPGKDEVCSNGIDDDCDGYVDMDDPECTGQYKIDLISGWNLVSLPKINDSDIIEIANTFNNDFGMIVALKNAEWYVYDKTANSNLNGLSEENGFWIKLDKKASILIEDEAASFISFNLNKGWNLIGFPSVEEKEVNELFQNVMDDIGLIYVYNDEFIPFNPEKPASFNIKPGMGIFVLAKNDVLWYFDGVYRKGQQLFNLDLSDGWNLISIPLSSNKTISEMFGSNILYYIQNSNWKQLKWGDKINYQYGYWIKASAGTVSIEGYRINNLDFDINAGWNLMNYPLLEETNADVFFQNVMYNIELIAIYEGGEWKTFNSQKPPQLNSLTELKPGKGIFVKAKNNAQWLYDGTKLVVK